jgi:hypothetical protein
VDQIRGNSDRVYLSVKVPVTHREQEGRSKISNGRMI